MVLKLWQDLSQGSKNTVFFILQIKYQQVNKTKNSEGIYFPLPATKPCAQQPSRCYSGMLGCRRVFVLSDGRLRPRCPGRQRPSVALCRSSPSPPASCVSACSVSDVKVQSVTAPPPTQKIMLGAPPSQNVAAPPLTSLPFRSPPAIKQRAVYQSADFDSRFASNSPSAWSRPASSARSRVFAQDGSANV